MDMAVMIYIIADDNDNARFILISRFVKSVAKLYKIVVMTNLKIYYPNMGFPCVVFVVEKFIQKRFGNNMLFYYLCKVTF